MLLQDHNRNSSTADRVVVEHVLILVLMEYALRATIAHLSNSGIDVLILVLMEYALREHFAA
jgi:hypothetical protein